MIWFNHSNYAESPLQNSTGLVDLGVYTISELLLTSIENVLSSVHVLMRTVETGRFLRVFLVRGL